MLGNRNKQKRGSAEDKKKGDSLTKKGRVWHPEFK